MSELKKGQVVRLKSGGPNMVIEELGNYELREGYTIENGARCVFFDKDHSKKILDIFDVEVLELSPSGGSFYSREALS